MIARTFPEPAEYRGHADPDSRCASARTWLQAGRARSGAQGSFAARWGDPAVYGAVVHDEVDIAGGLDAVEGIAGQAA